MIDDDPRTQRLRHLMGDDISLDRAWHELNDRRDKGAASTTVEALMFSLRERGATALKEPQTRLRLGELTPQQLREAIARLIKLRLQYPAISDDLLRQLQDRLP